MAAPAGCRRARTCAGRRRRRPTLLVPQQAVPGIQVRSPARACRSRWRLVQQWLEAPEAQTGTWNRNDVVLFKRFNDDGLYAMPAGGGRPDPGHGARPLRVAKWSTIGPSSSLMAAGSCSWRSAACRTTATAGGLRRLARFARARRTFRDRLPRRLTRRPGYLLFMRGETSWRSHSTSSDFSSRARPVPIAEQVERTAGSFRGAFSRSPRRACWRIVRPGRDAPGLGGPSGGNASQRWAATGPLRGTRRFSPDGRRVAVAELNEAQGTRDIWVINRERGTTTRVTFGDGTGEDMSLWSPDGSRVGSTPRTGQAPGFGFFERAASGTGRGGNAAVLAGLGPLRGCRVHGHLTAASSYLNASRENPFGHALVLRRRWMLFPGVPILEHRFEKRSARSCPPNGRAVAYTSGRVGKAAGVHEPPARG